MYTQVRNISFQPAFIIKKNKKNKNNKTNIEYFTILFSVDVYVLRLNNILYG